jgi:hypothetical protein
MNNSASKKQLWTGRVMSAIVVLFLSFDAIAKLLRLPAVVEGTAKVGYPDSSIQVLGIILLVCTLLYAAPPTAALGAALLTGYLGGAVATHLRIGDPLFSHVLFPVYMGAILWAGLLLRRPALRGVVLGST